jgi:hypothetical protein
MHEERIPPRYIWRPAPFWIIGVTLLVIALACLLLFNFEPPIFGPGLPNFSGFTLAGGPPPPPNDGIGACPRPQGVIGLQPGFNDQERDIRALRKLAFRNDFFAQLELGRRYSGVRATDKNIEDPVEAAVWYAMALANPRGYAPLNREIHGPGGVWRPVARLDDCREWERHAAYHALDRLLTRMSSQEQDKVRNRVVYVLSTLGADGFRTLGRLYDYQFGPFGEPSDNPQALEAVGRAPGAPPGGWRQAAFLFPRNDVDAYMYNYLAMQTGDVSAYVMLKDFEHSAPERASYGGFVEAKAKRWVPPYEFYPPDAPAGGVPHSDESHPRGEDAFDYALTRMPQLPFVHVGRALYYLGITDFVPAAPADLPPRAVQTLQADLGLPMDGVMNNLLAVRAIQYAAVNGSAQSQLALAVMYVEGIGVPADYARGFYWFTQADRQGSPEAKFAMASFFARGVEGVADQDKAKAVVLRLGSAMAGFQPTAARLQAMLTQVASQPRPPVE